MLKTRGRCLRRILSVNNRRFTAAFGAGTALLLVSGISVNHLFSLLPNLRLSSFSIGVIGWLAAGILLMFLARSFILQIIPVFCLFLCVGIWLGPYLEPPSDIYEHLNRINSSLDQSAVDFPRMNGGLWHYSMLGVLLVPDPEAQDATDRLMKLDVAHGLVLAMLMSALFALGRGAHLPGRYAFMSCMVALFFFGTNRFSYFSYYSFAPTSTSLLVFWIWTGYFFFKRRWQDIAIGSIVALLCVPIILVNHKQEAAFLFFLVMVWLALGFHRWFWHGIKEVSEKRLATIARIRRDSFTLPSLFFSCFYPVRYLYWLGGMYVLFILPQQRNFQLFFAKILQTDLWTHNGLVLLRHHNRRWHLIGKIWDFRIPDTLGMVAVLVVLLSGFYFSPYLVRTNLDRKVQIWLLAMLPFVVYCIPLFNFFWVSSAPWQVYYRLCYSSMFWLFFASLLYGLEGRITDLAKQYIKR